MDASAPRDWHPGDDLWPVEGEMLRSAAAGDLLDASDLPTTAGERLRSIRAAVLRHLVVDEEWPVHARGVRLRGVQISGPLDLEAATLRCPLRMEDCHLDDLQPVILDYATISLLILTDCYLAKLTGEAVIVTKDLDLSHSTFTGPIGLSGADITGRLVCSGANLTAADGGGYALAADQIKAGGVYLDDGFTAAGAIGLSGADITGQLVCSGANLTAADGDGYALAADQIKAGGNVLLGPGFTAVGAIRLTGADISNSLICSGAQLTRADPCALPQLQERQEAGQARPWPLAWHASGRRRRPRCL